MKILVVGTNCEEYLAKTHEAFRVGLQRTLGATLFGKGYPSHVDGLTSFQEVTRQAAGTDGPDVLITYVTHAQTLEGMTFDYEGIEALDALVFVPMSDFWNMTDHFRDDLPKWLEANDLYALSYYPNLPEMYAESEFAHRFVTTLPTFDPVLFNDWGIRPTFDVGLVGSGVLDYDPFYPERWSIRQQLNRRPDLHCLWKPHPGWGDHPLDHPQVGAGFSRLIQSCRFFICSGGKYDLPLARYFETMASRTVLMGIEPVGAEEMGLVDGQTYIKITPENVLDKIDYYLARPELCERIAEAGYWTAMRRHSCFSRALDFLEVVHKVQKRDPKGSGPTKVPAREGFLLDRASEDWRPVLEAYLRAFTAEDQVSLLITPAPGSETGILLADLQDELLRLAEALGLSRFAEVVVLDDPAEGLDWARGCRQIQCLRPQDQSWATLQGEAGARLAAAWKVTTTHPGTLP